MRIGDGTTIRDRNGMSMKKDRKCKAFINNDGRGNTKDMSDGTKRGLTAIAKLGEDLELVKQRYV